MARSSRDLVENVRKILREFDELDITVFEAADEIMNEAAECMEAKAVFEEADNQMGDRTP